MVAVLVALTAITFATGAALGGSGEERAKIDLIATSDAPGATGEAELQIRGLDFEFEAKVEGLTPGLIVSFCLDTIVIHLDTILIDTEDVEDQGRVELSEDNREELDPIAVPLTILGRVTIREGFSSCAGNVLLEGFVNLSDLE